MFAKGFISLLAGFSATLVNAQSYTSYFTGDTVDVVTDALPGTVLMGGATENDNAMRWFLERADGGDVVVIRASGEDGYNDYFYSELGVTINSVETIVFNNEDAAADPYVIAQIRNAEALWIAGGDQWDYVSYWKDNEIELAINYLINEKHITVGGTSAGSAIQGDAYFSAENGTVYNGDALNDPYDEKVTLGFDDFLENDQLVHVITDTHFDNPDRRGRFITFIGRLTTDFGFPFKGIACEEYTAVCIDENNIGHVYGSYPAEDDYVYFAMVNCVGDQKPDTCVAGVPLDWHDPEAMKVVKFPATENGINTFDLNDWKSCTGEFDWENWWVETGTFKYSTEASPINCDGTESILNNNANMILIYPDPAKEFTTIRFPDDHTIRLIQIYNAAGQLLESGEPNGKTLVVDTANWPAGNYVVKIIGDALYKCGQFVKLN